jgi:hypothetical protein
LRPAQISIGQPSLENAREAYTIRHPDVARKTQLNLYYCESVWYISPDAATRAPKRGFGEGEKSHSRGLIRIKGDGVSVIASKVIRMLTRRDNDWLIFLGIAVSIVSFVYAAVVLWELFKAN